MLKIRKEQMRAIGRVQLPTFEKQMLKHVQQHFCKHLELLGEEGVLKVIRHGYERGKEYDFFTRHEVCLFIDFMIMLGSGFDTDPQLPWVADILKAESAHDPTERIDTLYDKVMEYLDRVIVMDQVFPVEPLRKLLNYPVGQLEQRLAGGVERGVLVEFRRIWPQKFEHVEVNQLSQLIKEGIELASAHGFTDNRGIGFYLILMFLLGHRFDTDPQYPWLSGVLNDQELKAEIHKCERLYSTYKEICSKALE
ncbi:MAG: hypothetical protein H8D56_19340 [Planctomycetes bacterium]|nr:hypothetical protein [Planctomycetota bacterium]MBL7142756.1 hypothetical protein [Phycisphaerae bacterium]